MNLTEDAEVLELVIAGLPCKWGEATKKYKGFIGEGTRYVGRMPAIIIPGTTR